MFINLFRLASLSGAMLLPMLGSGTARADEIRLGVAIHDSKIFDNLIVGGVHGKEQSMALLGEYVFKSPKALHWALSPKPYIGGSLNLEGETSFGGAGLVWRTGLRKRTYGELAFGGVLHNGHVRTPNPALAVDPLEIEELRLRKQTEIEFGSKALFRTAFAFGYEISDDWAMELVYEHYSHGQILGGPENEGSNDLGVRVAKRF